MNDLSAAIGLAQLKKLPEFNKRRGNIIEMYLDGLKGLDGVQPLLPFDPKKYVYQMFGIRAEKRDKLMIYLKSKGMPQVVIIRHYQSSHYSKSGAITVHSLKKKRISL